jgi:serine/threonine-protein kinase
MIGIEALIGLYPGNLEEDSRTGEILWQHHGSVSPGLTDVLTKMVRYHFKDRLPVSNRALQALYQLENPATAATVLPTLPDTNHRSSHQLEKTRLRRRRCMN